MTNELKKAKVGLIKSAERLDKLSRKDFGKRKVMTKVVKILLEKY